MYPHPLYWYPLQYCYSPRYYLQYLLHYYSLVVVVAVVVVVVVAIVVLFQLLLILFGSFAEIRTAVGVTAKAV